MSKKISKSVLDTMEIKEVGLPLSDSIPPKKSPLGITGHCPRCGAAIFGYSLVEISGDIPCRYSCTCRNQKSFEDTIRIK